MLAIPELIIFAVLVGLLVAYQLAGWAALFAAVFLGLVYVSYRNGKLKCRDCGKRPITVRGLRYCGQCGASVARLRLGMICPHCRRLARSELNVRFCNRCGVAQDP